VSNDNLQEIFMVRINFWACMIALLVWVLPVVAQQPASANYAKKSAASATSQAAVGATVSGSGSTNFIPLWTNSTALGSSALFQLGGKVSIGKKAPAATLDVNGSGLFRGVLQLPATGNATKTAGMNSQPFDLLSSAFSNSTNAAESQHFRWQAEPLGNDTASPSGTLNLLFASGTGAPAETGLSIGNNGVITFAPAQTLPGADVTGDLGDTGQIVNINATNTISASIAQFTSSLLVPTIRTTGDINAGGNVAAAAANITGGILAGSIGTAGDGSFANVSGFQAMFQNSSTFETLQLQNFATPANNVFVEAQFNKNGQSTFFTDALGDTTAIGIKHAAVPLRNHQMVNVTSMESTEVWFEDFGSGQLTGGIATVSIEASFQQIVSLSTGYHVFVTPKGDCKGLFVANESTNDFEVRELSGGQSSAEFDYRIVAHRKGYEKMRLPVAVMPRPSTKVARP
jgi:hypothetical protein